MLERKPHWVTCRPSAAASLAPIAAAGHSLALPCRVEQEWAPSAASHCQCGRLLSRWRSCPAVFFTLSQGLLRGHVLFLRCFHCQAVYAGDWRWGQVPESSIFPEGFHRPTANQGSGNGRRRWFFAAPQVCWEVHLLTFLLGCLARGGMSCSAVFDVYTSLWQATMRGTQFEHRSHFINKFTMAILAWAVLRLLRDRGLPFLHFAWHLRPPS